MSHCGCLPPHGLCLQIFDYPVLSDMIRALEDTLPDGHPMLSACVPPSTDNGPHFQRPSHLGRQATERPSPCALHRTSPGATADGNAIRQQSAPLSLTMPSPHGSRQASHPKRQAQEDLTQGHSSERRRQASIHSEGSWSFPVAVPDLSDEGAADDAMGLARGGSFAGYSAGDPAFCCGLDGFPGAAWDQLSPASSFRGVMRSRITEEPAVHGDVAEDEGHAVIAEIEQDLPSDEAPDASWRSSEAESGVTPEERARGAVEGAVRAVVGADATAATALADGGVDSVSALEIRNKIAEALGVDLPETLLFDYPTAEELIPFVSSLLPRPAPRPASRTAPASRSRPPLHASQATRFGPQTPRSPAAVGPFGGTSPAAPHVAAGKPGARRSLFGGSTSARSSIEMPAVPPRVPSGRPPRHSTPQGSPLRRTLSDLPKAMHEAGGQTPPHRTPPRVPGGPQRSHHRMGPGRRSGATSARASWNEYVGSSGMQGPATWEEKQMMDHVTGGGLGAPGPAPTLALVPMYIPGSAQPVYALQPVQLGAPNGHPRFGGCSSETGHAGWAKTAHPDWLGAGGGADWTDNDEVTIWLGFWARLYLPLC